MTNCRFPGLLAAVLTLAGSVVLAQPELEIVHAQGNVYLVAGPGGNSAVQIGHEAVIVVDSQTAEASDALLETIRQLSSQPIRHILVTNSAPHRTGGNEALSLAGRYVRLIDSFDPRGLEHNAAIMSHVNVLDRMSAPIGEVETTPPGSWPTDTYYTDSWALFVNNEAIQLLHVPAAYTDGDSLVFFRRSDVIVAGDIYNSDRYPNFDAAQGGSINGVIEGLNMILDLTIAGENQTGGTVVIPGFGRLSDETDVANYRDMITIIRDRIQALVNDGKSLREVLASKPTSDYDALYARNPDSWTGERLVEEIYLDLTGREQ
jgi:cyclase